MDLVRSVLREDSEYRHCVSTGPSVIFDVGANIGVTALYFATLYPAARIYCFEPLPENVALLRENTAPFSDRITIVPKALGDREGSLPYCYSDDPLNFGGGTFYGVGCDRSRAIDLPMTTMARACAELGIDQIDLLKIDTEGAEMAVLRGIPDEIIRNVRAVIGELHGVDDFAFLSRLSSTHSVGFMKQLDSRCFHFEAIRRSAS